MQIFPSINHENVWTIPLPVWWAMAQTVDKRRKDAQRKARQARPASRSRRR